MLNRNYEIVICSRFVNCELWSCDMNSTLGSAVPLAMFGTDGGKGQMKNVAKIANIVQSSAKKSLCKSALFTCSLENRRFWKIQRLSIGGEASTSVQTIRLFTTVACSCCFNPVLIENKSQYLWNHFQMSSCYNEGFQIFNDINFFAK